MPSFEPRPKITVEDLLRLKRAERPDPEFWNNFERELRQKQLTALLEKRPWWQAVPQLFARRAYLPVGATAILAFTIVSLRYHAPAPLVQTPAVTAAPSAIVSTVPTPVAPAVISAPLAAPAVAPSEPAPSPVMVATVPASVAATTAAMATLVAPPADESPSARSIAANFARLEQTEPEMISAVLGNRLSQPARVQAASANTTELASVPVDGSKRSRILAQYSERPLSPEPTPPEIVRERLARRLVDPEISERLSRVGLKSGGLTLRL